MSEWPTVRLGEVADLLAGYPFPSAEFTENQADPRLLRGDNVGQGALRWGGAKRWPARRVDGLDDYWLQRDDVILAMDRPWIEAGLKFAAVRESDLPSLLVQRVSRIRGGSRLDRRYLKHVIASRSFTDHILSVQTGTTIPHISAKQILDFEFRLPPIAEQWRIAGILGALDDKIELNRQRTERLDQAARAIFQDWFISSPVAASWPGFRLADVFDVNPMRPLPRTAPAPYLDMANMPTSGPSALAIATRIPGSGARFENGDTLLARITPCLENGKTALVDFLAPGERGWGSTEYIVLRPRDPLPDPFAYCLARQPDFVSYAVARMNGSSGRQRVSAAAIGEFEIRTPPPELARRFGDVVGPMFQRITLAGRESNTLADIRELLLPRLLSGPIERAA